MVKQASINSRVAEAAGIDTRLAAKLTEQTARIMSVILCEGDSVVLPSFGEFATVKTDEYVVADPSGSRRTLMPPSIKITFTPGTALRKKLK